MHVVYMIMPLHAFNFLLLQYVCCILSSFVKSTELSGILGLKINIIIIIITKASLTMFSRMHGVRQLSLIFSHTPCGVRQYVADTVCWRYENKKNNSHYILLSCNYYFCPSVD